MGYEAKLCRPDRQGRLTAKYRYRITAKLFAVIFYEKQVKQPLWLY